MTTLDTRRAAAPVNQRSDLPVLAAVGGTLFAIVVAAALFTLAHAVPDGSGGPPASLDEPTTATFNFAP